MNDNLTRSKVAYNLDISPHKLVINYDSIESLTFIFSSELYRQKFIDKMEDNREKINKSLSSRFGFKIINNKLCDIKLYSSIEKRGFLIKGKEEYRWLNTIKLDGHKLMNEN